MRLMETPPLQPPPPVFLDLATLLETSEPRPRVPWFLLAAGMLAALTFSAVLGPTSPAGRQVVEVFSGLLMMAMVGVLVVVSYTSVRTVRAQQQAVDDAAELIQLRHW